MKEFRSPDDLTMDKEDTDCLETLCPAEALCLNQASENEVGRILFVFNDKGMERPIAFMSASLDAELMMLYDAVAETKDYSSFVVRMTDAKGNAIDEKNVSSDYLEWMYGKPIQNIIDTIRTANQTQ